MFKIGDKVECIRGAAGSLVRGKIYTVIGADDMYIRVKELTGHTEGGWAHSRFKLIKQDSAVFDMNKESWFISVKNKTEYDLAIKFCEEKGFTYFSGSSINYRNIKIEYLTNTDDLGFVSPNLMYGWGDPKKVLKRKEIKLKFEIETKIASVDYPEVKSEKDIEIERIEEEMRKLADRVKQLKGE